MLGWRDMEAVRRGFPTLADLSIELRLDNLVELIESSDGRRAGETSFSSGTGVGGLLKTRPFFKFLEDSIGVANDGGWHSSSLSTSWPSSSEEGPSKPANKLLDLNGLLIPLSFSRPKGPLSLFPGYRSSIFFSAAFSSSNMRS
jgi:hypothetical protein